jgi:hypothetical protein
LNQLQGLETNYLRIAQESAMVFNNNNNNNNIHHQNNYDNDKTQRLPSIAVCISGMPERLQPWHAFQHLVAANADKFRFHVIFAIGEHTRLMYSSRPDATFSSTRYAAYNTTSRLTEELQKEGRRFGLEFFETTTSSISSDNTRNAPILSVLPFIPDVKEDVWLQAFDVSNLDRISQYVDDDAQVNILNMYNHQVECAKYIERLEEEDEEMGGGGAQQFDWIISTREDAHYFYDMDLEGLLQKSDDDCDLITKDCLDFEGINMRFQLLRGKIGLEFLKSRLDVYKGMYKNNKNGNGNEDKDEDGGVTIRNPEIFEDRQAGHAGMKICKRSVSAVPVNVGRHTTDGGFCFLPFEVEGCVPPEAVRYVDRKRCYNFQWKKKP